MYAVKEIFYTLQGEGANAGRAAVFCRFAGCNLWSGREADRDAADCRFCDTDFVGTDGEGGGKFANAAALAGAVLAAWAGGTDGRFVVLTCHPGFLDATLVGRDGTFADGRLHRRQRELELLRAPSFARAVAAAGFTPVTVAKLASLRTGQLPPPVRRAG